MPIELLLTWLFLVVVAVGGVAGYWRTRYPRRRRGETAPARERSQT